MILSRTRSQAILVRSHRTDCIAPVYSPPRSQVDKIVARAIKSLSTNGVVIHRDAWVKVGGGGVKLAWGCRT